jgi:hypothetical protein
LEQCKHLLDLYWIYWDLSAKTTVFAETIDLGSIHLNMCRPRIFMVRYVLKA